MNLPNLKELNKLVALCRKTGVKVFELGEMRITLTDAAPAKRSRAVKGLPKAFQQGDYVPNDLPSDEELLFASAGGPPDLSGFEQ